MDQIANIKNYEKTENAKLFLKLVMDIGSNMLISGAEIHRVEDSMRRICYSYGADDVNVFSITYTIIVTISSKEFGIITQTRRIESFAYNLHVLEKLNDLSRKICEEHLAKEEIEQKLNEIMGLPKCSNLEVILAYAIISSAFTLFFGGHLYDAVVSACIGVMMRGVELLLKRIHANQFFIACLCSTAAGLLAMVFVELGFGYSIDKISIGNVMVLIPGLMFTNSVRDMFADNMISGFVRLCEAVFLGAAIAFGFAIAGFR